MLLNEHTPYRASLLAGSSYHVCAGQVDRFQEEVAVLWDYLRQAVKHPISITLEPRPQTGMPCLADLSDVTPSKDSCSESWITLYTSGTTGMPKPVKHRLLQVYARKHAHFTGGRWLLTYLPFRWAGLSVLMHVLKASEDVIVPPSLTPADMFQSGVLNEANCVSITPSLLRKLLLAVGEDKLRRWPLKQITFGGEAASQSILDIAKRLWPDARCSHVYASTEVGDICAVSDGLAGIPREKFDLDHQRFGFSPDGELVISGVRTGDLWELRGDRYHFVGRCQEIINVGGAKISPLQIEEAALSLEGIQQAKAYPVESALLGHVVGLDYIGSLDEAEMRRQLCTLLPKVAWPRMLRRVNVIELTEAGKISREAK